MRADKTCRACGEDGHNLASCDTEDAAIWYETHGRHDKAARVRRRMALIATPPDDEPLDAMRDRLASARKLP